MKTEPVTNIHHIAILASGSGSNAQQIIDYFSAHDQIHVAMLLSNNPNAYALERAKNAGVMTHVFNKADFYNSDEVIEHLDNKQVSWIVLAGFLWLLPPNLINKYENRIINIHPSLLPKHGGKGMYGHHVHAAVVLAKDKISGITIHFVNKKYDEGKIIFQASCELVDSDNAAVVAQKVQKLEHEYFPKVIESVILGNDIKF